MPYFLPPISKVPSLSVPDKKELLDHLFERCDTLHSLLVPVMDTSFPSYHELIETFRKKLLEYLDESKTNELLLPSILKIIAAHPRLGAPKPTEKLSEHSKKEQASLASASQEEAEKLKLANELYEETFPGLRYVVFVNGRPRLEILKDMQARIQRNDIGLERQEAINAMCYIAIDRAAKLQGSSL